MIVQLLKNLQRKLRLRHFGRSEDGQALVLAALAMLGLLMMAGLGVDVGYLRYQKEQMQKAADAGALAAASAIIYNGNYVVAATNDTKANGFTAGQTIIGGTCSPTGTTICVAVNNPPLTPGDPFLGQAGYVEVIVAQARPTFFMQVAGYKSTTVSSRAVASSASSSSGCVYAIDQNDDANTLVIDSGVFVGSPSCAMYVESSNASGLNENGGGGVSASYIGVVGTGFAGSKFTCEWNAPGAPCPQTTMAQFMDPFLNVPAPTPVPCCTSHTAYNYPAGTYNNINISEPGGRTYTFGPGLITVQGSFTVAGNPILSSNAGGVLFYLTGPAYGGVTIGAGAQVKLSAQTTGSQAGILFFQNRSLPIGSAASHFSAVGGNNFSGAFYFPTTKLYYAGTANPSLANSVILDAWQIEFNGNSELTPVLLPDNFSPLSSAILVE